MSYRREDINNSIWDDEDFDALGNNAALLYIWSFTNPRCGMAGIYRVKRRHLCEGRLRGKALDAALAELAEARMLFYTDGFAWVRSRVKNMRTKGDPMKRSIRKDYDSLPPDHPFREAFCAEYLHSWIGSLVQELQGASGGSEGVPEDGLDSEDSGTPQGGPGGSGGRGRGYGSGSEVPQPSELPPSQPEAVSSSFLHRCGS